MISQLSTIGVLFWIAAPIAALLTASPDGRVVANQRADSENVACRLAGSLVMLSKLSEASGVAASRRNPGVLWSHNDSGQPMLFAIGTDGTTKGQVQIAAAQVDDWEDVAVGPCPTGSCLYIGDVGDNNRSRKHVTIYRVPEPAPHDRASAPAEAFHATYPDGPRDAEGIFVIAEADLFVVTKDRPITVYRFPPPLRAGATIRLQRVAALDDAAANERVTGAAASPDGRWIALRTHRQLRFYRSADVMQGAPSEPLRVDIGSLGEAQGEGVAFGPDRMVYLVGEGGGRVGSFARLTCNLPE